MHNNYLDGLMLTWINSTVNKVNRDECESG